MKRWIGEFAARDARGNRFTLEIWREFISPGVWGESDLRTAKGELVYRRVEGEYEIASSGLVLRSESDSPPNQSRSPSHVNVVS